MKTLFRILLLGLLSTTSLFSAVADDYYYADYVADYREYKNLAIKRGGFSLRVCFN